MIITDSITIITPMMIIWCYVEHKDGDDDVLDEDGDDDEDNDDTGYDNISLSHFL